MGAADGSGEAVGTGVVTGFWSGADVGVAWGVGVTWGEAGELDDGWGVGLELLVAVPDEALVPLGAGEGSAPPVSGRAKAGAPMEAVSAAASMAVSSGRAHLDVLFIFSPSVLYHFP